MCEINQNMFFTVKGEYFSLGLNPGELLLYSMILNYYEHENKFTASNNYLSTLFDVSERTIQLWIRKLKDKKLIKVLYATKNEHHFRYITPYKTQKITF